MKKIIALLLVAGMLLGLCACNDSKTTGSKTEDTSKDTTESVIEGVDPTLLKGKKVGFAQTDSMSAWRTTETDSLKKYIEAAGGEFIVKDAGGDIATEASDISDLVAAGVDYLIVAPLEDNGLQNALEEAMNAGIKVILVDRAINGEAGKYYTTAIRSDFYWEGQQCAEAVKKALPDGGNIVIINGGYDSSTSTDRQGGFVDSLDQSKYKIIAEQDGEWLMDKAQAVMENIIQAQGGENIDVVFAVTDDMIQGAKAAIEAAGLTPGKDILTVGIDGTKAAFEDVKAGKQLASCTCSPYFGPIVYDTIAKLEAGEDVPEYIQNEDTLYTIDNVQVELGF